MLSLRIWRLIFVRFTAKHSDLFVLSLGQKCNAYFRELHRTSQTSLELHFLSDNEVKNPYENLGSMLDHFGGGKNGFDRVLSLHF